MQGKAPSVDTLSDPFQNDLVSRMEALALLYVIFKLTAQIMNKLILTIKRTLGWIISP